MLSVLPGKIAAGPGSWLDLRGTGLVGSGFERQSANDIKKEEAAAPEIEREDPNLEARLLTHGLSNSELERDVIAETYQGVVDSEYIREYQAGPASDEPRIGFDPAAHFYRQVSPKPTIVVSDNPVTVIAYASYTSVARVSYLAEQSYEGYEEGSVQDSYVPEQRAVEQPRLPHNIENRSVETYSPEVMQADYVQPIEQEIQVIKNPVVKTEVYVTPIKGISMDPVMEEMNNPETLVIKTEVYEKPLMQEAYQMDKQTIVHEVNPITYDAKPVEIPKQELEVMEETYVEAKTNHLESVMDYSNLEVKVYSFTEESVKLELKQDNYFAPKPELKIESKPEYIENIESRIEPTVQPITLDVEQQLIEPMVKIDYDLDVNVQDQVNTNAESELEVFVHSDVPVQTKYQEQTREKAPSLAYSEPSIDAIIEPETSGKIEPLEQKKKASNCYARPELKEFSGFGSELKKADYIDNENKTGNCTVIPELKAKAEYSAKEQRKVDALEDKVELSGCDVIPELRERFYVNANTEIKWLSFFDDPVNITSELVADDKEYTIRVKGMDLDFDRPYFESKSATYVTKANSGAAMVDKLFKQRGLVPTWEVDYEITEDKVVSGTVYLKDVMGVNGSVGTNNVDYLIRLYDKETGKVEQIALDKLISMEDIRAERYQIDVITQVRYNDEIKEKKEFREHIDEGYKAPVAKKREYKEGTTREEPLSGTGGIDEYIPKEGEIFSLVLALQGTYDRDIKDIEGAYDLLKIQITKEHLQDDSDYFIEAKDINGFDTIHETKANKLSAILAKELERYDMKGVFMQSIIDRKAYEAGGEMNGIGLYIGSVQGALTEVQKLEPNSNMHEWGLLLEREIKPCGGKNFLIYHNPEIYDKQRKAA